MRLSKGSFRALLVGILMTGLQIGFALSAIPPTKAPGYASLCNWDCSDWYQVIAREGYHSSIPPIPQKPHDSNVAFFPAFPLLARMLSRVTHSPINLSLVILSQLACVYFWTALWMLLRRWRVPDSLAALVILATLAHPAAFYLVTGYSESLFLASLLFFILCASSNSREQAVPASLSGALMSATRILGLTVALYPIARQIVQRRPLRLTTGIIVALIASTGTLLFFLYCKVRFGQFNLYLQTQRIGWGVAPDYLAPFKWSQFVYHFGFDRWTTILSGLGFLALAVIEALLAKLGRSTGFRTRAPIYFIALLIFYITVSGLKNQEFISIIRYSFPWYVLLVICLAHLVSRLPRIPLRWERPVYLISSVAFVYLLLRFQIPHLRDYLQGRWVS